MRNIVAAVLATLLLAASDDEEFIERHNRAMDCVGREYRAIPPVTRPEETILEDNKWTNEEKLAIWKKCGWYEIWESFQN